MRPFVCLGIVSFMFVVTGTVLADEQFPPITSAALKSACSDCHMVYQPQMLPRRSWQAIMDGLDDHFGEDASLEEPVRKEVLIYLLAHAADVDRSEAGHEFLRGINMANPPLRITETPHFMKEHRKIRASTWNDPKVGSKANCVACHTGAPQGNYEDD